MGRMSLISGKRVILVKRYGDLGGACTWWLNIKLDQGRKQDSAGWEGILVYDCSREEAVFIIDGRGGDLFIFEFQAVN